ncbi:lyase family protein [Salinisphaera aquimarina]|uniref:Lyase family protein n=1 Tax=Salinisphaera aquimarina TaxID=2094031 RepID=A0ABV7EKD4_9GAMM
MTELLSADAVRELFSARSRHQSWLDVEAALALAEGELGMIPKAAAEDIARHAHLDTIDAKAFTELAARNRAPILALVETLATACDDDAGAYVHWGGTTQNIIQTARIVQMKKAHAALMARLGAIFGRLAGMADESAEMVVAGRSNRRQGLPITFGFKVAAWIDEMLRHEERLKAAESRVFMSQFGGALGAMHAFGDNGPALNAAISTRLGLAPSAVPVRSALDHIAEYMQLLALLAGSCAKIAREFYTLMTDELGEVIEDIEGAVGSSTMPQKVNSKIAVKVMAHATRLRGYAATTLEAMQPSHEGDAASNMVMYSAIDEAVPLAYELTCLFDELLASIRLIPDNMRRNLAASDGLIMAEKAMMLLAAHVGRSQAHHLVQESVARARRDGNGFASALAGHEQLPAQIDAAELAAALRPETHTGQSVPMARRAVDLARKAAARLG